MTASEQPPQAPSAEAIRRSFSETMTAAVAWLRRKPRRAAAILQRPIWEQWIAVTAFVLGAAVVSMFVFDGAATINAKRLPAALVDVLNWLTDFGRSNWFLIPAALMFAACAVAGTSPRLTKTQHRVLAAIAVRAEFVFTAIAIPGLVDGILKRVIGRARPLTIDWNIPHTFSYSPFTNKGAFHSMPSGHATTAVCAAIVLGSMWPKALPYLWIYAGVIMLSRVVLLAHHVSDVLVGALIGAFFAILVRDSFAARGLIFTVDSAGRVLSKPGPSWRRIKALARTIRGQ